MAFWVLRTVTTAIPGVWSAAQKVEVGLVVDVKSKANRCFATVSWKSIVGLVQLALPICLLLGHLSQSSEPTRLESGQVLR